MIEIIIITIVGIILFVLSNKLPQTSSSGNFIKKDEVAEKVDALEERTQEDVEREIKEVGDSSIDKNTREVNKKPMIDISSKEEITDIKHLITKAVAKVKEKDYLEAEKLYEKVLEIDKDNIKSYVGLGIIYIEKNELGKAIESLEKVCQLDPTNASALNNLGLAYYAKGNFKKAIETYEKSLSLNNKIVHRFINLALACKEDKNFKKEVEALRAAIRLEEKPEYLSLLGETYLHLKELGQAKKTFERILELDPENVEARRELSKIG